MPGPEIMLPGFECQRCGHRWVARRTKGQSRRPVICPGCRSPYWERPFERVRVKAAEADKVTSAP